MSGRNAFVRAERLVLGELGTNCWLVEGSEGGSLVVIDPAGDAELLLAGVGDRGVEAIVLTHGHFDHLGAVGELVDSCGAPLLVHEDDAERVIDPVAAGGALFGFARTAPPPDRVLRDGDIVEAGAARLQVIHTPGHTAGSICLLALGRFPDGAPHLFSGDTLFAGSVGRTDLPGGSAHRLRDSILSRLVPLADGTVVHPGHGPDTSIGRERRLNPFFPRA